MSSQRFDMSNISLIVRSIAFCLKAGSSFPSSAQRWASDNIIVRVLEKCRPADRGSYVWLKGVGQPKVMYCLHKIGDRPSYRDGLVLLPSDCFARRIMRTNPRNISLPSYLFVCTVVLFMTKAFSMSLSFSKTGDQSLYLHVS